MRSLLEEERPWLVPDEPAPLAGRNTRFDYGAGGPRRRRRTVALIAIVVIVLGLAGSSGVGYVMARALVSSTVATFKSAENHLETGKALLAAGSNKRDLNVLKQARDEFVAAKLDFNRGQHDVDSNPLIHVGVVPKAGRYVTTRVSAVDHLGEMGKEISDVGMRAADIDLLLMTPAAPNQPKGSKRLLDILGEAGPSLQIIQQELRSAKAHAAAIDPAVLPKQQQASLMKAKTSLEKGISGLDEFGRLLPALRDILAADGRRVYLVEQSNPFELRAGGGYIGSYTLIAADHGNLQVLKSGDTHDLADFSASPTNSRGQPGYVAPPKTMLQFLDRQSWSLPDSNFFSDFAANAQAALSFSQRDFGTKVDGVISLDLYCVGALLSVTGPMQIPGHNLTVDSGNLISQLVPLDLSGDPNHKRVLSALAGPLMEKLTTLGSERWPELIKVLNDQAGQRHVQLWFASDKAQPEIQRLGLSGDLVASGRPDFLYEVESNFSGNKANFFLRRSFTLTLTRTQSGLHHELTEDLLLDGRSAPASYDVSYTGYYRLFVPAAATARHVWSLTPDEYPYTSPPSGTAVIDGWQRFAAGASRTARFTVTYAWDTSWSTDASGHHQIYWQKQPGTANDGLKVVWKADGKTWTGTSDLRTDRLLTLATTGLTISNGVAAQAQLPSLAL